MQYTAITIQGNIISSELLDKIRSEEIKYQTPADFGLDKNIRLRDEIGVAWAAARGHWTAFKVRRDRLQDTESGTSETRNSWMLPLLRELGYEIETSRAETLPNGKAYAISHRDARHVNLPVHITGVNESLDRKREGVSRLSSHALVQEYLNQTEHVYGLVSNGRQLRLLRDATRLVRLSYLEFNLEKIMEEELYNEFAVLYRLLHASRMPDKPDEANASLIEFYHQESLASGNRIREKLSAAVEESILTLANGFLQHTDNTELRQAVLEGRLEPDDYYQQTLRLIYRLLFLMVTEERNLVYPETLTDAQQRLRRIYTDYYSLDRLRKLAGKRLFVDGRKHDLWESLKATFLLFEDGRYGQKIEISPLGSGLFSPRALGDYLTQSRLSNENLLQALNKLSYFTSDSGSLVRVNYSDLDVEEFGSVYEGLLEYEATLTIISGQPQFSFVAGTSRAKSGSHYTPEELVQPLIKYSLDYLIADKLKEKDKESALLSLKICDPACGSGHILLSAARRVAMELARVRTGEDQPSPTAFRLAIRDVIRNCIYGVDKNPMAVELCKVALWLESHNPGEPLGFLDHRIRCGDAIVGLTRQEDLQRGIADEAFKPLPRDDKDVARALLKRNKTERSGQLSLSFTKSLTDDFSQLKDEYASLAQMPEHTPAEVEAKQRAFEKVQGKEGRVRLLALANAVVAPFFIPKTAENESRILTEGDYRQMLRGFKGWQDTRTAYATATAAENRFFHWFLEFPDVFTGESERTGFNCVLGNPPFLGGKKLSGAYGDEYLNWLYKEFEPTGAVDLVAYFFRRAFTMLVKGGFQSLIATNTVAQGGAREASMDVIAAAGGSINHAVKSMRWPGLAAVEVALVTITKQIWNGPFVLAGQEVNTITTYLDDAEVTGTLYSLEANANKGFVGSMVLGKGFVLEPEEAKRITDTDAKYHEVLFPYLNGEDLNNSPTQKPSRFIINFFNWPLRRYSPDEWSKLAEDVRTKITKSLAERNFETIVPPNYASNVAADYPICLDIIEKTVLQQRQEAINEKVKVNKPLGVHDGRALAEWWLYLWPRPELYTTKKNLKSVLCHTRVTKTHGFAWVNSKVVFSDATLVFIPSKEFYFTVLQSSHHEWWAWHYSSSMKGDRRYSVSLCYQPFPFPQNLTTEQEVLLECVGESYHNQRQMLMIGIHLGLTKTYNIFHSPKLRPISGEEEQWDDKKFEKEFGKDALALRKHLAKTPEATLTYNEAVIGIQKLRTLHLQMDNAVRDAYGWQDLNLAHDFYEVDYLPENDRIRYTISPAARKEVLKRLLQLNHKLYAEEQAAKAAQNTPKSTRKAKAVTPEKAKTTPATAKAPVPPQPDLFSVTTPLFAAAVQMVVRERARVTLKTLEGTEWRVIPVKGAAPNTRDGLFQYINPERGLGIAIMGHKEGDTVEFGGKAWTIVRVEQAEKGIKEEREKRPNSEEYVTAVEGFSKIDDRVKSVIIKSLNYDLNTSMKDFGLHQGIYSVSDAANMLGLPPNKIRDWFKELVREGYEGLSDGQRLDAANRLISFHGLIELYVIGKLRDDGVPIRPILKARTDLKNKTGKQYPFATNNVKDRLRTDGRRIYFYFEGDKNPVTLDGSGQFNLDLIKLFFDAIEFNTEGIAQRMFPARGNRKVVIDPKQGNGKPVIVDKEVLVNLIASIYDGPESLPMLAEEYNLNEEEVRGALNYAQIPL